MNQSKVFSTKALVACGLLTGLSIILTRLFSSMIPLAGLPALRIGFGDIPVIIAGILFGPIGGALTGGVSDVLGFMMNSMGGPFIPGLTISAVLRGLFPGLIYWLIRGYKLKINFHIVNIVTSILLALGVVYVFFSRNEEVPMFLIIIFLIIVLAYIMLPVLLGRIIKSEDSVYSFDKILFVVTFGYFIISLGLNTYWLALTYEKGFLAFLPGRILAGLVVIPMHSIIIYILSKWFKYIKIS